MHDTPHFDGRGHDWPDQDSAVHYAAGDQISARIWKLKRIRKGKPPRVLDLFAGCGGMSLGFQSAGFGLSAAVENDPIASASHAKNFFGFASRAQQALHAKARDITATPPNELIAEFGLGETSRAIDVICGGPPCQAFARVGRAKLREIAEHPSAFKKDKRAALYLSFMEYIAALQPLAVVMENVPDVINYGGHNIPEEMADALEAIGYESRYTLLNSALYGVPQMRERMFFIAYAKELSAEIRFPTPTHHHEFPVGYEGTRNVALKNLSGNLFAATSHFIHPPVSKPKLLPAVTAKEAIGDLPPITLHLEGKLKRGARRFTQLIPYPERSKINAFAKMMRTWPGFESEVGIYDHVIRYLPRDYPIFKRMEAGDQYPQAHQLALRMLEEELSRRLPANASLDLRNRVKSELRSTIVPPYDVGKFPNKWRKMESDFPARTLLAHLGKDGYSHIHYDSKQARTISVREAARLQSFPDGFQFEGTMNPAFRQIGNAVPPLLAKALATTVKQALIGK